MEEIIGYLLIPFIPFIIVGNFLVLLSIYQDTALRERAYCLIGCLALADFLAGCVSAPSMVYAYMWHFPPDDPGGWKDIAVWYLPDVISTVCLLHTLLLTTERLVAVLWPLKSRVWLTVSVLKFMSATVWIIQFIWWALPFMVFPFDVRLKKDARYIMFSIATCYILPLIIIIIEWIIILFTIKRFKKRRLLQPQGIIAPQLSINSRPFIPDASVSYSSNTASREDQRLLKTIAYVSVMLILGYVPNSIWWSMSLFMEDTFTMQLFSVLSNVLQVGNCIVNPIIYAAQVKRFRLAFLRLLHLQWMMKKSSNESSSTPQGSSDKYSCRTLTNEIISQETDPSQRATSSHGDAVNIS